MNARILLLASLAASALTTAAPSALAQAGGGATTSPSIIHGAPVPGVCVWDPQGVMASSKVGQAVVTRLKVLAQQVEAELQPEADAINTEQKTLQSQQTTMDSATMQARRANLELRYSNFAKRQQLREQELTATRNKQFGIILKMLQPVALQLYQARHCSMLFDLDSGALATYNPLMDFSHEAAGALDLKIQTLNFDREHLDTQPPPGGGQ